MSTPGKNGLATVWPKARISHGGMMRRAPSTQPMYQSGCDPDVAAAAWVALYGPYSHTGLIWASPPRRASTAATSRNSAADLAAYWGHSREPTMLSSVRPGPLNWVCFWRQTMARWALRRPTMRRGDDQDVEDVEAGDELGVGELPAEDQERHPRPGHGHREGDRVGDPHAGARQQVVEQRVAEEAVEDGEHQQGDARRSS